MDLGPKTGARGRMQGDAGLDRKRANGTLAGLNRGRGLGPRGLGVLGRSRGRDKRRYRGTKGPAQVWGQGSGRGRGRCKDPAPWGKKEQEQVGGWVGFDNTHREHG